ncbi:hypothetical protein ABZ858_32165 [Streptomyces sp. NPDC047017]|uniref:hypothetical protein n=1 Tax=Streptomyces sp. NPDC047017 TaxID=3155024 RepID=UPI0033CCBF7F
MKRSTWAVHVRMENHGQYAEYRDRMDVTATTGRQPTARDVIDHVKGMIINQHPEMKSGRVVRADARQIS